MNNAEQINGLLNQPLKLFFSGNMLSSLRSKHCHLITATCWKSQILFMASYSSATHHHPSPVLPGLIFRGAGLEIASVFLISAVEFKEPNICLALDFSFLPYFTLLWFLKGVLKGSQFLDGEARICMYTWPVATCRKLLYMVEKQI